MRKVHKRPLNMTVDLNLEIEIKIPHLTHFMPLISFDTP